MNQRRIRVFQKNTLKPNLNFMRIAHENVLQRICDQRGRHCNKNGENHQESDSDEFAGRNVGSSE